MPHWKKILTTAVIAAVVVWGMPKVMAAVNKAKS